MIAESTPSGTSTVRAKKDWYNRYFELIHEIKPAAISYINSDWESQPMWKGQGWGDARVQKHQEILNLWNKEMKNKQYIHGAKERPIVRRNN